MLGRSSSRIWCLNLQHNPHTLPFLNFGHPPCVDRYVMGVDEHWINYLHPNPFLPLKNEK